MAQRFTAAISGLLSVLALAAEGDRSAHKDFFNGDISPAVVNHLSGNITMVMIIHAAHSRYSDLKRN